ncbi:hypothetical protein [Rhizobium ruizarguesonis]|uniref:hypothetical protein n=1 Tax=Rhizobium ruizarguesonis TaxID=2081791 RepID=UPI001031D3EC|nr:hypothetical protein [Rhizobium ruizarguesonis]TAT69886.1 hypothetical protein ELI52_39075 [Rhizobium ruizarguesonis]
MPGPGFGPSPGNIPIQNTDERLAAEVEHAARPIHDRNQPQFAVEGRGGGYEFGRGDERDTSAALNRGKLDHTLDMKGGSAYVGGHSRETESKLAYDRDAGPTRPQETRREQAGRQDAIDASNAIEAKEAVEGPIQPPKQPEQGNGQQQEQRPQAQQREQAQPQPQAQKQATQGQGQEPPLGKHETQQERERQNVLTAKLRGKLDALEGAGIKQFGARQDITSAEMFNTAKETYYATKDAIRSGKFSAMANNAMGAAGTQQQPEQATELSSSTGRFGRMADRAIEGTKTPPETGTGIKKDTGLERG